MTTSDIAHRPRRTLSDTREDQPMSLRAERSMKDEVVAAIVTIITGIVLCGLIAMLGD